VEKVKNLKRWSFSVAPSAALPYFVNKWWRMILFLFYKDKNKMLE